MSHPHYLHTRSNFCILALPILIIVYFIAGDGGLEHLDLMVEGMVSADFFPFSVPGILQVIPSLGSF